MKKFLFTLAALLMAGSICAEDYMFIEDFEVPQSVVQGATAKARRMDVSVMAHFEAYVNVFMVDFEPSEGITVRGGVEGEGMSIPYIDKLGNDKVAQCALNGSDSGLRYIGALTMGGYWYPEGTDPDEDDPVNYGSVKFLIGEYEMFVLTLQFDQGFTGGTIGVVAQPACGADTRGPVTEGTIITKVCNVSVETPEPVVAEAPVFAMDENYTITATCANDYKAYVNGQEVTLPYTVEQTYEEQTIVVTGYGYGENMENSETVEQTFTVPAKEMPVAEAPVFAMDENFVITATCANDYKAYIDGQEVTLPYTVEQTWEEQTITVTGYGYGENMQNSETVEQTFVVPALEPTPAAAPEFIWDEATFTLTVNCNNAYKVYVDGAEVEVPYTVEQTYEEQTITVTGYGYGDHMTDTWADPATFVIPAMERPVTADPTITVEYGENNTSATVTIIGEGTIYYSFDGNTWTEYTDPIYMDAAGEYTVYAKADMGGDYVESGVVTETVIVEAAPQPMEKTGNPSISAIAGDQNYTVVVTAPAEDPDADLFYRVRYENGVWSDWMPYTGEVVFTEFGYYEVEAYAQADGKDVSNPVSVSFYLDENTSAAEILGGKTVASTRYFNMAGQEMSEANGVCIIVTTFTDGTSSAVKVMK